MKLTLGCVVQEALTGFHLYVGVPGKECGHIVSASSYFDRLWAKEQNVDRYFMCLSKVSSRAGDGDDTTKSEAVSVASFQKGFSKKRLRESSETAIETTKKQTQKMKKKKHVVVKLPGGKKTRRTPKKNKNTETKVENGPSEGSTGISKPSKAKKQANKKSTPKQKVEV